MVIPTVHLRISHMQISKKVFDSYWDGCFAYAAQGYSPNLPLNLVLSMYERRTMQPGIICVQGQCSKEGKSKPKRRAGGNSIHTVQQNSVTYVAKAIHIVNFERFELVVTDWK